MGESANESIIVPAGLLAEVRRLLVQDGMSDDEAAFVAGIRADPSDQAARLIYADWLDERDRDSEARWLRADVRFAVDAFPDPKDYRAMFEERRPAGVTSLGAWNLAKRQPTIGGMIRKALESASG